MLYRAIQVPIPSILHHPTISLHVFLMDQTLTLHVCHSFIHSFCKLSCYVTRLIEALNWALLLLISSSTEERNKGRGGERQWFCLKLCECEEGLLGSQGLTNHRDSEWSQSSQIAQRCFPPVTHFSTLHIQQYSWGKKCFNLFLLFFLLSF